MICSFPRTNKETGYKRMSFVASGVGVASDFASHSPRHIVSAPLSSQSKIKNPIAVVVWRFLG